MPRQQHVYRAQIVWTGNRGAGTRDYRAYGRDHEILADSKSVIPGSADPGFRGDAARWNPEELLIASLSACHQLWFLHLCSAAGVVVTAYEDHAEGLMIETEDGGGHFETVTLRPRAHLAAGSDPAQAEALHHNAHEKCFTANSVNFPVTIAPSFVMEPRA